MTKRKIAVFALALFGFVAGYWTVDLFQAVDRGERAVELFDTYCLSDVDGERAEADDALIPLSYPEGTWADPAGTLVVQTTPEQCRVSDILEFLTVEEWETVEARIPGFVEQRFPRLTADPDHGVNWDSFLLWVEYPIFDPKRWGVTAYRYDFGDGNRQSALVIKHPSKD